MRFCKSAEEIKLIKQAIDVTTRGFRKVIRLVKPGVKEYEIEAEWAREFIRRRSKFAYTPIIASGANACVLHYLQNDQTCRKGQLLLMDVGACYANYNADLTRTIPVSGKFSSQQKEIYSIVFKMQEAALKLCKAGNSFKSAHLEASRIAVEGLKSLGLMRGDTESAVQKWCPCSFFPTWPGTHAWFRCSRYGRIG